MIRNKKFLTLLVLIIAPACFGASKPKKEKTAQSKKSQKNAVKEINSVEEFNTTIKAGKPVIAKFFSPACGHCKTMKPIFERISSKYPNVTFVEINADAAATNSLFSKYHVDGYPTFVFISSGNEVKRHEGSSSESHLDGMVASLAQSTK